MENYRIKIVPRNDGEHRFAAYLYKEKRLPILFWIKHWEFDDVAIGFIDTVHAWVEVWKGRYNIVKIEDKT